MENLYLYIALGTLAVIVIVALIFPRFRASLSKKGFDISGEKPKNQNNTVFQNMKDTKVKLETKEERDYKFKKIKGGEFDIK